MEPNTIIPILLGIIYFIQGASILIFKERDQLAASFLQKGYDEEKVLKYLRIHGWISVIIGLAVVIAPIIRYFVDFNTIPVLIILGALLVYDLIRLILLTRR